MTRIANRTRRGAWALAFCVVSLLLVMGCKTQQAMPPAADIAPQENLLRIGVTPDSPPLISKQGKEIVGLEAELARAFAGFLGKSVAFVELAWEDQIPALLENRTDIIMSGMSITAGRQYRIAFSEPYFRTGQIALVRKDDSAGVPMPGYYGIFAWMPVVKIGVIRGTTGEFFVKKNFSDAKKIVSFATSQEAVAALKKRWIEGYKIDLLIHDAPMIHNLAAENEGDLVPLPALLSEEYLAWGIRKSDVELLESANAFIDGMKKAGKLNSIIKRWIPYI